jgi:sigma-E factor negative regulatory protein RseA
MDTNKKNREVISALMDDALPQADAELAMAALAAPDGAQAWARYHLIGDTLRAQAGPDLAPGFGARLAARLADEPAPGGPSAATDLPAAASAIVVAPR